MVPLPPAIERLSTIEQNIILTNKNYYPQIATIPESKIDKIRLTNEQIKDLNLVCYKLENGSITVDQAVLKLRAGGFYDWATLAFILYMFSLKQSYSFQGVPLPYMDPIGWLNGKYDHSPMQHTSYKSSKFELEMAGVNDNMCLGSAMAYENGFLMSYEDAYNLVSETYPGYLEVNESCQITD